MRSLLSKARSGSSCSRPILMLLLLILPVAASAQAPIDPPVAASTAEPNGDALNISILTFGPGTLYWERFGHDAILVRNLRSGEALTYNYGYFDFRQKNFFLNFARGKMLYKVAPDDLRDDLAFYEEQHRSVIEQNLALTPAQRVKLSRYLEWNSRPENANYYYDYFRANCATRVRDAIDLALDGALRSQLQAQATPITYRFAAVRMLAPDVPFSMAMDAALGPNADLPLHLWDESFLPVELMQALRSVHVKDATGNDLPLVEKETKILAGTIEEPPAQPPDWRLRFLLAGLALAGLLMAVLWLRRAFPSRILFAAIGFTFELVCGIGGLILVALWALTDHWAGWRNANLLIFNPLCLLMLPAMLQTLRLRWQPGLFSRALSSLIAVVALLGLAINLLTSYQLDLPWILLLLPTHLLIAAAFRRAPPALQ